jgi:Cu(I)/Ag(I) efflux system periplasmic protein CusF
MTKALIVVAMPALLIVAGCSKPAEQTAKPVATDAMANMVMPTDAKSGKGVGKVTAIDPATGKITLDHGPITELQWPAMTMGFGTKPDMLKDIDVGDSVAFEFEWDGSKAEITRIRKQ